MRLTAAQLYVALLCLVTLLAGVLHVAPLLRPVTEPGLPRLAESLEQIPVATQRTRVLGYERSAFGSGWGRLGACTTREAVMATHFHSPGCTSQGTAPDLYTGMAVEADDVEIDHVFPLAAAWDLGAHTWDHARREAFANDPANLIATSAAANREKSDQLPGQWLPPQRRARCWYVRRVASVAASYGLALPREDVAAMRGQCRLIDVPRRPP